MKPQQTILRRGCGTRWALLWLLLLLLSACGQARQATAPSPTQASSPTQAPSPLASATPPPGMFQNPVLRYDFPDPGILHVDGTYYVYATNGAGRNVQVARSPDLVDWELLSDAMPALATWVTLGNSRVWAPEVLQIGEQFVLYYTARDKQSDRQCIGVATSTKPEGKFRDTRDSALVCQLSEGGSIDASPFRDSDGRLYLYWKSDGNCCNLPTYLYVQELAADGLSLLGEPVQVARNDQPWEGNVIEAPTMWQHQGNYYLFFSANSYAGPSYAVGYATCTSALGPCTDAAENPILASQMERPPLVVGPGHQAIVQDTDGETWMIYHVWEVTSAGLRGTRRFIWIDQLIWNEGKPDLLGPTTQLQPFP